MKIIKTSIALAFLSMASITVSQAGPVLFANYTDNWALVHALTDSSGALVPASTSSNLRIGYFDLSDNALLDLWNAGDLVGLNDSFTQFGNRAGMGVYPEYDGLIEAAPHNPILGWEGRTIYLFASTGSDFLDATSEYLIFKFNVKFSDSFAPVDALLLPGRGDLLVGEFNNYSFGIETYDFVTGSAPAFNTVGVIPEPSSALLLLLGGAALALRHRMRREEG